MFSTHFLLPPLMIGLAVLVLSSLVLILSYFVARWIDKRF